MTSVEDAEQHPGCPLTTQPEEDVDPVKEYVLTNNRLTVREAASMLGISFELVRGILVDNLTMCGTAA